MGTLCCGVLLLLKLCVLSFLVVSLSHVSCSTAMLAVESVGGLLLILYIHINRRGKKEGRLF
ncbi:hypothetical protein I3843_02G029300 [Carya illinoinensis]|nr:hypothetical protein I3760_02G037600 [Carya illinoinensis]KAG7990510.1 hypothetical protein I3843_02G029300 [Carya illinoinensis]